jgi:hypothetical protein
MSPVWKLLTKLSDPNVPHIHPPPPPAAWYHHTTSDAGIAGVCHNLPLTKTISTLSWEELHLFVLVLCTLFAHHFCNVSLPPKLIFLVLKIAFCSGFHHIFCSRIFCTFFLPIVLPREYFAQTPPCSSCSTRVFSRGKRGTFFSSGLKH